MPVRAVSSPIGESEGEVKPYARASFDSINRARELIDQIGAAKYARAITIVFHLMSAVAYAVSDLADSHDESVAELRKIRKALGSREP